MIPILDLTASLYDIVTFVGPPRPEHWDMHVSFIWFAGDSIAPFESMNHESQHLSNNRSN